MVDIAHTAFKLVIEFWLVMIVLTVLFVPQLTTWGTALSCVNGMDLSSVPTILFVVILGVLILGGMKYLQFGKR